MTKVEAVESKKQHSESLPEVWVYEMCWDKEETPVLDISCVPFTKAYFEEYKIIYNACFYPMRRALEIEPYNWYSDYSQMADKVDKVFLLLNDGQIIGSVACLGNEIDDLIVRTSDQKKGYGKQLLLWAINQIRQHNDAPITLHVAEWNQGALQLYEKVGFSIRSKEKIR